MEPRIGAAEKALPKKNWYRALRMSSVVLFLMCLPLPAFFRPGVTPYFGWYVLLYGPLGLVIKFKAHWPWLANLALFSAWLSLCVPAAKTAAVFSAAAVLSAGYFLVFPRIMDNEGDVVATVTSFGLGYWFWLASIVFALAAAGVGLNIDQPTSRKQG